MAKRAIPDLFSVDMCTRGSSFWSFLLIYVHNLTGSDARSGIGAPEAEMFVHSAAFTFAVTHAKRLLIARPSPGCGFL